MSEDIDIPIELQDAAMEGVKRFTSEMMSKIAEKAQQIVWQVANDYIHHHLEVDAICNLQDTIRQEVVRCSHSWCRDKENFWGKSIRKKLLEEHKDEILPLIHDELLEKKDERISDLEKEVGELRERLNILRGSY